MQGLVAFGDIELDVSAVAQLVEASQTRGVVACLKWIDQRLDRGRSDTAWPSQRSLASLVTDLQRELDAQGLNIIADETVGDIARPRNFEVAAAFNRLRTVQVEQRQL